MLVPFILHDILDATFELLVNLLLFFAQLPAQFFVCLNLNEHLFFLCLEFLSLGLQLSLCLVQNSFFLCQTVNFAHFILEKLPHASTVFLQLSDFGNKRSVLEPQLLKLLVPLLNEVLQLSNSALIATKFTKPALLVLLLCTTYLFESLLLQAHLIFGEDPLGLSLLVLLSEQTHLLSHGHIVCYLAV